MNAPSRQTLTDRELRWLRNLARHGPQSSEFLLEVSADTHRCRDTGQRTLQKLRETGYLRRPPQQKQIAKADFNPHVYDLTPQARLYHKWLGDPIPVRPQGHWGHSFLTASITSALAIAAGRQGYRYIPAHEILGRSGATLAVPVGREKLIPDALFAIQYQTGFRSFVLEVDRGTEPLRSQAARKSLQRSLRLYHNLAQQDHLRRHYTLKSPLLHLFAFTNPTRAARCLEMAKEVSPGLKDTLLVQTVPEGFPRYEGDRERVCGEWRRNRERSMLVV